MKILKEVVRMKNNKKILTFCCRASLSSIIEPIYPTKSIFVCSKCGKKQEVIDYIRSQKGDKL